MLLVPTRMQWRLHRLTFSFVEGSVTFVGSRTTYCVPLISQPSFITRVMYSTDTR